MRSTRDYWLAITNEGNKIERLSRGVERCYNTYKIKDDCAGSIPTEKSQKIFFVVL